MDQKDISLQASPRSIGIATLFAALISALVLVTLVLPAEFGIDPLGTGSALGLTALSGVSDQPLQSHLDLHKSDYAEFILEPFQSVEYKYLLDIDYTMVFSWQADGDVYFDFHADPAGLGSEYALSFDAGTAMQGSGAYHAPFTGIHGWFWENRSFQTVTVTLHSAGHYINGTVFQDGGSFERELIYVTPR